jgi:Flp pilus assembly protein TadG
MLRKFWADRRGNYAMMTVIAMLPLMGGLAVAIDYSEMSRERSQALNALDAAGIATATRYLAGGTEAQLETYASDFFKANANGLDPSKVTLTLTLPDNNQGGGSLKLRVDGRYNPYFLPVLTSMLGKNAVNVVNFSAETEIRLKNTLEVALVLDNSGSMSEKGGSSGKVRMDLLKAAAKELVKTLAGEGNKMKQVPRPVQFSVVPFAASVNIGPDKATASWMDQNGISPIHHENFDWTTMSKSFNSNKYVEPVGTAWYMRGTGWGSQKDKPVTRFTMYKDVKYQTCTEYYGNGSCKTLGTATAFASWKGCVEARPHPYNVDDTPSSTATPATLFVPMFAPDESSDDTKPYNSWFPDGTSSSSNVTRQSYMPKYFTTAQLQSGESVRSGDKVTVGPNQSCTTVPITPLTDVTIAAGLSAINTAIDAMQPNGATNVPEGMAWGWRTVSSGAPFTEGRSENEKGNDKVVIVVTDGANTYYTPGSLGYTDGAGNKSTYSPLGYVKMALDSTKTGRIFQGTSSSISKTDYANSNYTDAMNEHFKALCDKAKAKKIMVMTVALDLDARKSAEKTQIDMLKECASESRYRKEGGQPAKLFWNSTGASLSDDFKAIGNELSNLRIVG